MTVLQYLRESQVGTTAEILKLKREDSHGFDVLMKMAREQMVNNNVVVEEPAK